MRKLSVEEEGERVESLSCCLACSSFRNWDFLLVSKQIDLDKYYNQDDLISTDNELGKRMQK